MPGPETAASSRSHGSNESQVLKPFCDRGTILSHSGLRLLGPSRRGKMRCERLSRTQKRVSSQVPGAKMEIPDTSSELAPTERGCVIRPRLQHGVLQCGVIMEGGLGGI